MPPTIRPAWTQPIGNEDDGGHGYCLDQVRAKRDGSRRTPTEPAEHTEYEQPQRPKVVPPVPVIHAEQVATDDAVTRLQVDQRLVSPKPNLLTRGAARTPSTRSGDAARTAGRAAPSHCVLAMSHSQQKPAPVRGRCRYCPHPGPVEKKRIIWRRVWLGQSLLFAGAATELNAAITIVRELLCQTMTCALMGTEARTTAEGRHRWARSPLIASPQLPNNVVAASCTAFTGNGCSSS